MTRTGQEQSGVQSKSAALYAELVEPFEDLARSETPIAPVVDWILINSTDSAQAYRALWECIAWWPLSAHAMLADLDAAANESPSRYMRTLDVMVGCVRPNGRRLEDKALKSKLKERADLHGKPAKRTLWEARRTALFEALQSLRPDLLPANVDGLPLLQAKLSKRLESRLTERLTEDLLGKGWRNKKETSLEDVPPRNRYSVSDAFDLLAASSAARRRAEQLMEIATAAEKEYVTAMLGALEAGSEIGAARQVANLLTGRSPEAGRALLHRLRTRAA